MLGYISIQDDLQTMLKAYKYRIYPNREQQVLIEKHFGCSRFVFNWALALQQRYYAMFGKSLSRTKIQSHLVKKKKKAKFSWLSEVNSQSLLVVRAALELIWA